MAAHQNSALGPAPAPRDEFACWGVYSRACATRRTLARVADKWTILVVGRLSQRPCRLGELRRSIEGISSKVLTETLRKLEGDGLLTRSVEPTSPPAVTYALTPLGRGLGDAAIGLRRWAERHADEVEDHRRARARFAGGETNRAP